MKSYIACTYCGSQNPGQQANCSICQKALSEDKVDTKLLMDALNFPTLLRDISTGWTMVVLIFFSLISILTGLFQFETFIRQGMAVRGYGLVVSGSLMIVCLLAMRKWINLGLCLSFAFAAAIQGAIVMTITKFLSWDFFVGVVFVVYAVMALWKVPSFQQVKRIPKAILDKGVERRNRIFSPRVNDESTLLLFENEKGKEGRILVEDTVVMMANESKTILAVPRSQFTINMQEPFVSSGYTKVTLTIGDKRQNGKISPAFWEKYKNDV